jgi:hypothetical protein
MSFRKYILFPISTCMAAIISAFVIIGTGSVALLLLLSGSLANLVLNRHRDINILENKQIES